MTHDFYSTDATRRSEIYRTEKSKGNLGRRLARRVNTLTRCIVTPVAMAAVAVSISVSTAIPAGYTLPDIGVHQGDSFIEDIERRWSELRSFGSQEGVDVDQLLAKAAALLDSPHDSVTEAELEAIIEDEIRHLEA